MKTISNLYTSTPKGINSLTNSNSMKTIFKIATPFVLAIALASCGGGPKPDSIEGKKARVAELRTAIAAEQTELKKLEADLLKMGAADGNSVKSEIVKTTLLSPTTFKHFIQVQGAVTANQNVMVNARMAGIVSKVYVREGDVVSKGQILAQVDVEVMKDAIKALKTNLELAKTVYERRKNLFDQKIGSEIDYLSAKNNYESLQRQIEAQESQIEMGRVVSPISGTIDMVNVKQGEVAAPGFGLIRVVNNFDMRVSAKVADSYLGSVKKGDNIAVKFPDTKDEFMGMVSFVSATVDPISRTFLVEVNLPEGKKVRPNQIAVVNINDRSQSSSIVIDENIVQFTDQGPVVFVTANEGGKEVAKQRILELGQAYNGKIEVLKGLQAGDNLISFGFTDLVDGSPISIQK
jgi:RND family efflux transporter MFP subunit